MSARIQIAAVAVDRGWTVADNGRFMNISKGNRFISVTLSVRGAATKVRIANVGTILGSGKAERVIEELMK